jgi:hypothetical protein
VTAADFIVVESLCIIVVVAVAGWRTGGMTLRELLGLSDPPEPESPPDDPEGWLDSW